MKHLNNRGITHLAALAVLVVGFSTFGSYKLVANQTTVKAAANLSLTTGAQLDGSAPGTFPELTVKTNDVIVITSTVENFSATTSGNLAILNTVPAGLTPVAGSLTVNGKVTKALVSKTNLTALSARNSHQVSFKAKVTAKSTTCGDKILTNLVSLTENGRLSKAGSTKITVCPAAAAATAAPKTISNRPVATPKPKPSLSLEFGVHNANTPALGILPEIVTKVGETVEFQTVVKNTGPVEVVKPVVSFLNVSNSRFTVVQSSILVDGVNKVQYTRNAIRMENLPVGAQRTVTFKATIKPNVAACGTKAIKASAKLTASGVSTQMKPATIQVCP